MHRNCLLGGADTGVDGLSGSRRGQCTPWPSVSCRSPWEKGSQSEGSILAGKEMPRAQRMQTLRTVQVCCPSPPGLPVCDRQRVMPQEQRGRLPMLAGLGAGWARGAPPAAAQLPTACGEIRVCGSQAGSSALLTGKGDEAETMTAGCEKLEPFGLGRRAVSCRPQWLFAPALPPGTRLPPPNRPAAGRMQA